MIGLTTHKMQDFLKNPELWKSKICDECIDDEAIIVLNRLLGRCNDIMIEYPYYDDEYLSTYYLFYAKKYLSFPKECYRIHLFDDENLYAGFITLRPTVGETKIGKSYISPKLFLDGDDYVMDNEYCVHVMGKDIVLHAIPWMKQDTDIAVCGHVATWIAMKAAHLRGITASDLLMGELVKAIPEIDGRMIPTSAISVRQMVSALSKFGFSPVNIQKTPSDYYSSDGEEFQTFQNELFAYIESRIAPIVCIGTSEHAVAAVGHGRVNYEKLDSEFKGRKIVYFGELLETVIVHDDAQQPYLEVDYKKNINAFTSSLEPGNIGVPAYYIEDFDRMIVPLRDRIQYSFKSLVIRIKDYIDAEQEKVLRKDQQYVERVYLVSSNDLKKYVSDSSEIDLVYRQTILGMNFPIHVWCVDFSTFAEYKEKKMSVKFIVDTTACNKAETPFLLIQTPWDVMFFEDGKARKYQREIAPYAIYRGNLERGYDT